MGMFSPGPSGKQEGGTLPCLPWQKLLVREKFMIETVADLESEGSELLTVVI